jgi:hypothetical protein
VVVVKAAVGVLYDTASKQRGSEGAGLLLGWIAPSPLTWATPDARARGVALPAPDDIQIGPHGIKTNFNVFCGNISHFEDPDRLLASFIARLPLLLALYVERGVVLTELTPVFIKNAASGCDLSDPPVAEDWASRRRALAKFSRPDDLGAHATPHSARGSGLMQEGIDGVPLSVSMGRALVKDPLTVQRYQRISRRRAGGARAEGMAPRAEGPDVTAALLGGPSAASSPVAAEPAPVVERAAGGLAGAARALWGWLQVAPSVSSALPGIAKKEGKVPKKVNYRRVCL